MLELSFASRFEDQLPDRHSFKARRVRLQVRKQCQTGDIRHIPLHEQAALPEELKLSTSVFPRRQPGYDMVFSDLEKLPHKFQVIGMGQRLDFVPIKFRLGEGTLRIRVGNLRASFRRLKASEAREFFPSSLGHRGRKLGPEVAKE